MSRVYRLRLLGREVASWEIERDSAEVLADAIAELADNTAEHTEEHTLDHTEITGGSAHNFERDLVPLNADGEEPWDDGFGFQP